jgi:hypothetical protein
LHQDFKSTGCGADRDGSGDAHVVLAGLGAGAKRRRVPGRTDRTGACEDRTVRTGVWCPVLDCEMSVRSSGGLEVSSSSALSSTAPVVWSGGVPGLTLT